MHEHLPPPLWVRVTVAKTGAAESLERSCWLTPYAAETILEDAQRLGAGAHLEVTVLTMANDGDLDILRLAVTRLTARGVQVSLRRAAAHRALDTRPATNAASASLPPPPAHADGALDQT